jgi:hypothetical protein
MTARAPRQAAITRTTGESSVRLSLDLDGTGTSSISTGVRFYDHMLGSLARHALLDLTIEATGDVDVDAHHTVEDVAIVLGDALREALGDKRGISRFGDATVPLDEALVQAVVDVAGRPLLRPNGGAGRAGICRHRGLLRRIVDAARLRNPGPPRRDCPPRPGPRRPRPPPPRRSPVQSSGAGTAGRHRRGSPRARGAQRKGDPVGVTDRGLLLLHGDADRVVSWARRGLVAVSVLSLSDGWVGVVPVDATAAAHPPYDDALGCSWLAPCPDGYAPPSDSRTSVAASSSR